MRRHEGHLVLASLTRQAENKVREFKQIMVDRSINIQNKQKEGLVIPSADAVVNPVTMVVVPLDTLVAAAAVMGARRAIPLARFAVSRQGRVGGGQLPP